MRRKKLTGVVLGGVICLAVILSMAILPAAPVSSANGAVNISISLASSTIGVNETFSVNIVLDAGTQKVRGVGAYIDFDPTYLQVQSVVQGAMLQTGNDLWIGPTWNNTAGTIDCSWGRAGLEGGLPEGNFTLATINLKALAATNSTSLTFALGSPKRNTDIRDPNLTSILGAHPPGAVSIVIASLNGQVTFQRPDATSGGPSWVESLNITVFNQGTTVVLKTYAVTTNETGAFSCVLDALPLGTYDIGVKGSHTLSQMENGVTINEGTTFVNFGTLLEGDADGNDVVAAPDFFMLVASYNSISTDPNWDVRCDFDNSGAVNFIDFVLLTSNFQQIGEIYNRLYP